MPGLLTRLLVAVATLLTAWPASGGGSSSWRAARIGEGVDACSGAARREIEAGLDGLALLDPASARAAFARAEAADPACPLAPWGLALAWLRLPDADASDAEWAQARVAMRRAVDAADAPGAGDPVVRALVVAARPLSVPGAALAQVRAFAASSWTVAQRHPDDRRAVLPAALAALATGSLPVDEWQRRAASLAAGVPGRADDPAWLAVRVLACEGLVDRGSGGGGADDTPGCVEAARALAGRAPLAPRALATAARVLCGRGAWAAAADTAAAAARASTAQGVAPWLAPGRGRDHPLAWQVAAEVERGRFAAARAAIREDTARYAATAGGLAPMEAWRWRSLIDLASMHLQWASVDWQGERHWPHPLQATLEAAGVAPPDGEGAGPDDLRLWREVRATRALVGGLLAARAAWPRGEPDRLAAARGAAGDLERLAADAPVPPREEWRRTLVLAATAAALEARDELALLLAHADALRDALAQGGLAPAFHLSGDALAGEWHLQLHDAGDAARRFTAAAGAGPGQARAWLGLARAERAAGRPAAAATACASVLRAWAEADEPRQELAEAGPCAARE